MTREVSRARRLSRGFTLIEIMVVVIIIGLLAAFIGPTVIGKVDEARVVKAKGDIRAIETAL
ncbi:MAG: prepilin-type N-terminal cleavage/methylation domain-containing protein, partial [Gammaproteobacteria bacterium]|nr:prepilin-type N-terminal cleavage/methylation domain-containing protein [Gammaproteobacteria bacterium]